MLQNPIRFRCDQCHLVASKDKESVQTLTLQNFFPTSPVLRDIFIGSIPSLKNKCCFLFKFTRPHLGAIGLIIMEGLFQEASMGRVAFWVTESEPRKFECNSTGSSASSVQTRHKSLVGRKHLQRVSSRHALANCISLKTIRKRPHPVVRVL